MLKVTNLSVSYGGHLALDNISLQLEPGERKAILGANGAGKSTLLKAIAGLLRGKPGSKISLNDEDLSDLRPDLIVERGIALVPEGRALFGDLSVAENLKLGAFAGRARPRERERQAYVQEIFPRLLERRRQPARSLSGGEQQMLAIGRALMTCPEILLLDEPSLGLSPKNSDDVFRALVSIASSGVAILLVEQNVNKSLAISSYGYVLRNGKMERSGTSDELRNDPQLVESYLGSYPTVVHQHHEARAL